jgi:threonine dehydratase
VIELDKIEEAAQNIRDVKFKTPCPLNKNLSSKYDCQIYLKREDLQIVRSFKIRGAYNKIKKIMDVSAPDSVVCASAGNHAQGVAYACSHLSIKGYIYMPTTTPNQKISKVKHFGGEWVEIILVGDTFDDANKVAMKYAQDQNVPFIHPFDDVDVMAGQGTIAVEMLEQIPVPLDYIFVAVGGGGLITGVGSYFKKCSPHTKIIGVEAEGAPALKLSLDAGHIVTLDHIDSFADGISVKTIGKQNFEIIKNIIDDILLVPEGKICSSILSLYNDEAIVVEPAGAVSFAALDFYKEKIKNKNVGIIVCGGNNDIARTEEIRERALLWEGRKHYFIIRFPQRAGALRDFLTLLGPKDDISHFEYTKKNNRDTGPALVGLELASMKDFDILVEKMRVQGIDFQYLNNNPMLFEMLV